MQNMHLKITFHCLYFHPFIRKNFGPKFSTPSQNGVTISNIDKTFGNLLKGET